MAPTTRRAAAAAAAAAPPQPDATSTVTTHPPVEVAVIGGGLCGTLAAAALARDDGAAVLVLDAAPPSTPAGGVWATAANAHSRLQAAACLYEWDAPPGPPRLTPAAAGKAAGSEWWWRRAARALAARAATALARVDAATVRAAIDRYGTESCVAGLTRRGATVTAVKEGGPGGGFWVEWVEDAEAGGGGDRKKGGAATTPTSRPARHRVAADGVIVAAGLLGRQLSPAERSLPPGLEGEEGRGRVFRGVVCYGGKVGGVDCVAGDPAAVGGKRVLVLGSGAFALEAAEAAAAAGAASVTLVCRPDRDRWVAPFSRQLAVAAAAACPAAAWPGALGRCARGAAAAALDAWLARLYSACGLAALAPRSAGPRLFSGQCHDGWFRLARAGRVRVVAGSVAAVLPGGLRVRGVRADTAAAAAAGAAAPPPPPPAAALDLDADVVVVALGCALNDRPAFLAGLGGGGGDGGGGGGGGGLSLADLHSFAFWGRRPRLGLVCDWVWFNVPHGPKQQIACFRAGLAARRAGPAAEAAFARALVPTPFAGCRGESLAPGAPSGFAARAAVRAELAAAAAAAVAAAATPGGGLPARLAGTLAGARARAGVAATAWAEWGWLVGMAGLEAWANWGWLDGESVA